MAGLPLRDVHAARLDGVLPLSRVRPRQADEAEQDGERGADRGEPCPAGIILVTRETERRAESERLRGADCRTAAEPEVASTIARERVTCAAARSRHTSLPLLTCDYVRA